MQWTVKQIRMHNEPEFKQTVSKQQKFVKSPTHLNYTGSFDFDYGAHLHHQGGTTW